MKKFNKTKNKILLHLTCILVMSGFAISNLSAQCFGAYDYETVTAPTDNVPLTITTCNFCDEYNVILNAVAGSTYQFTLTGGSGNFITITYGSPNGTVLGYGYSPVSVTPSSAGTLYMHVHATSSCGDDGSCHTATIQCTSCSGGGGGGDCNNSSAYGSTTAPTDNNPKTITTCAFAGEYSTVTGCVAGSSYQFVATGGNGNWITIRQGTPGGTVLGSGNSPLTVTCTASGSLYMHLNTDSNCGTDATCHTETVACTSCSGGGSDCNNSTSYGSTTAPTDNTPKTITTCAFGGEYSTVTGCVAGSTYQFVATGGTGNWITIRQGTPGGTVLGSGNSPLTVTCTVSGNLYMHLNTSSACAGSDGYCHTETVACTSCTGGGSGCNNSTSYGSTTAPTNNTPKTITTCAFGGEYSTVTGCVAGSTYQFVATGGTGNWITIRQGTPGGTVLGSGNSPLTVTCTVSGNLYMHLNSSSACAGSDGYCHTETVACTSCSAAPDPCTSISTLSCGASTTVTLSGAGLWASNPCWTSPGSEKIYSFTPTTSGVATLQVTSTNSGGYVDYNFKAASGGCSSSGWTCIKDVYSPGSWTFNVTGGVTYYLLLDAESTSSITQTFQIICPVASVITMSCPAAATVSCASTVPPPNPGSVLASTTCPNTLVTVVHLSDVISNLTCANKYTITRTYRATDACGASATCVQIITVNDLTPPTVICPADATYTCGSQVPAVNMSQVSGIDNCGGSVTLSYLGESISAQSCDNKYTITRTFRGTDACGNSGTCAQTITVDDSEGPAIANVPANITVSCSEELPAVPSVTATDNCGGAVTVSFKETSNKSDYTTLCRAYSYEINRIWTATDACGNTSQKVQKISVQDNNAPEFVFTPPQFITVECDDDGSNNVDPIAVDDCDGNPSVILGIKYKFGLEGCVGNYLATYTWTAGDKCGNTSQYTQYITVIDTEAPEIKCPPNVEVSSLVPIVVTWPAPKGSDYCDGAVVPVQIQGPPPGSIFPSPSKTVIVYQATDNCGNVSTCSFLVIVRSGNEGLIENNDVHAGTGNHQQSIDLDGLHDTGSNVLYQNEPNPFENSTTIRFYLERPGTATLNILDVTGRTINVLQGEYPAGSNSVLIENNQLPSSGMYYYQLRTKDFSDTKKMLYIK